MPNLMEERRQFFTQNGYVKAESVYSSEQVATLMQEYEKIWLRLVADGEITAGGERPLEKLFPRMRDYHRKNRKIKQFVLHHAAFELVESLIGEEALIISTSYYFKSPTTRGLPMHQDNYAFGVEPGTTIALWISLDEADAENGCLQFVPGTHDLELLSPNTATDDVRFFFSDEGQKISLSDNTPVVSVPTAPGDVVVFNGNIVHGSEANDTLDRYRRSLIVHFTGCSVEKLALNFNNLMDKTGRRVRKRLNTETKITEPHQSVFSIKKASYFDSWK